MSSSCRISTIEIYKLMFLFDADTGNPFPCFGTRNDPITFVIIRSNLVLYINFIFQFSTEEKHALRCSMMETKHVTLYTGNEKAIILFLFFETILMIVLVGLVQFCCIFWMKKKVKNQDLAKFLEKRVSWIIVYYYLYTSLSIL